MNYHTAEYMRFDTHFLTGKDYESPPMVPSFFDKTFPNITFYLRAFFGPVVSLCHAARVGLCDDVKWAQESVHVAKVLEKLGTHIFVEGMEHLVHVAKQSPCIIVGNHMSTLETFLLPGIVRPYMPVTFVVKQSLMRMPFFGAILATRNVIAVGRENPRQDLKAMLEEGQKRLESGMSLIIFPQSTRSTVFDATKFNSIGAKLARNTGCPLVPLALKTDAWGQGKLMRDFGTFSSKTPVHLAFGAPMYVNDNGKAAHNAVCTFIQEHLDTWRQHDGREER